MSIKAIVLEALLTAIVLSFIGYEYHVSTLDGSKHLSEGQTHLVHDNYERALTSFAEAMAEIDRSNKALFFAKGMTIDKTQNFAEAFHGMGCAYAGLEQYEDANDCLTAVLDFNAFYVQSRAKRAEVRCKLQDYAGAVSDYTKILDTAPNATHTYYARGLANTQLRNYAQALEDLARAVELANDTSHQYEKLLYTNSLARLLATCPEPRYRDGTRAVTLAEEIIATAQSTFDKDNGAQTLARFKDTLAAAYVEVGRSTEAVSVMRQAIDLLENAGADEDIDGLRRRIAAIEKSPSQRVD